MRVDHELKLTRTFDHLQRISTGDRHRLPAAAFGLSNSAPADLQRRQKITLPPVIRWMAIAHWRLNGAKARLLYRYAPSGGVAISGRDCTQSRRGVAASVRRANERVPAGTVFYVTVFE